MGALLGLFALLLVPFVLLGVAFKVLFTLLTAAVPHRRRRLPRPVRPRSRACSGSRPAASASCSACSSLLAVLVLLPLAPLILLGGIVWLALKAFTPATRPAYRGAVWHGAGASRPVTEV